MNQYFNGLIRMIVLLYILGTGWSAIIWVSSGARFWANLEPLVRWADLIPAPGFIWTVIALVSAVALVVDGMDNSAN
jgi:hypothetical protein